MAYLITPESEDLYDARLRTLRRQSPGLTWTQPEVWASAIAARNLALSSLKSYASAVRFAARRQSKDVSQLFIERFDAALKPIQSAVRKSKQRVRSKHRRVAISEEAVERLRAAADWRDENTRSTKSGFAMDIAEGTLRFGLRPSEWSTARVLNDTLIVQNGKYAVFQMDYGPFAGRVYRRANGPSRVLLAQDDFAKKHYPLLDRLTHPQILGYRTNERAVRRAWRATVETAIKRFGLSKRYRHLRLYDFRHQFAANWKKTVSPRTGIIAALMGHCSTRTAVQSYARVTNARGAGWGLRPSADSLDSVITFDVWEGYPQHLDSDPARTPQKPSASHHKTSRKPQ